MRSLSSTKNHLKAAIASLASPEGRAGGMAAQQTAAGSALGWSRQGEAHSKEHTPHCSVVQAGMSSVL